MKKNRTSKNLQSIKGIFFFVFLTSLFLIIYFQKAKLHQANPKVLAVNHKAEQKDTTPKKKNGEIIIKFKPQINIEPKNEIKKQELDMNRDKINISDLDEKTTPKVIKETGTKYKIKTIEKIFKNVGSPINELNKIKEILKEEIIKNERKIDENELLKLDFQNLYLLSFDENTVINDEVLKDFTDVGEVEYAEANYIYDALIVPNDPYYLDHYPTLVYYRDPFWNPAHDYQWNLKQIDMENAWNITTGNASIITAVVDSGVDCSHPEFAGRCLPGYDFVNNDYDSNDDNGHGTHVAGVIAANSNNAYGVASIDWKGKILPIKALDNLGSTDAIKIVNSIKFAVDNKARIINNSYGGYGYSSAIDEVFRYAYNAGVVLTAAIGNDAKDAPDSFPANITCASFFKVNADCVITVSSTDETNNSPLYSNWGSIVDVAAPGGSDYDFNVLSIKSSILLSEYIPFVVGSRFLTLTGTSMATAHVSGLAALMLSINPALTPDEVKNAIENNADDLGPVSYDFRFGYGRINAYKTLLNSIILGDIDIDGHVNISDLRLAISRVMDVSKYNQVVISYGK